jgi:hypothetical protein
MTETVMTETVIEGGHHLEVPNSAIMEAAEKHCPLFHRYAETDPPCLTCVGEVLAVAPAIAKGAVLAASLLIEPRESPPHTNDFKEGWALGRASTAKDLRLIAAGHPW